MPLKSIYYMNALLMDLNGINNDAHNFLGYSWGFQCDFYKNINICLFFFFFFFVAFDSWLVWWRNGFICVLCSIWFRKSWLCFGVFFNKRVELADGQEINPLRILVPSFTCLKLSSIWCRCLVEVLRKQ